MERKEKKRMELKRRGSERRGRGSEERHEKRDVGIGWDGMRHYEKS